MKNRTKKTVPRKRSSQKPREDVALRSFPKDLPPVIVSSLQALASRVLLVSWTEGVLRIIGALCILIIVQGTLDMMFDLPLRTRAMLILADISVVGFLVFRFGIQPWQKRLTPAQTALVAERHWPDLHTGLISAVQLARNPGGSPTLARAMVAQMASRIGKFNLREAVPWGRLKRLILWTLCIAAIFGGLIWGMAPKSIILLRRIALSEMPLPTVTIVIPVSRNFSLAPGQDVELSAMAKGVIPRSGRIEVTYEGKPSQTVTVSPKASDPETFSIKLQNIQQSFTYRFYLNDGTGEVWKVTLIHPPVVSQVRFDATPPAYTELPAATLPAGGLKLLAGSNLLVSGKSNQPLKSARLLLTGKSQHAINLKLEGSDHMGFSATVSIPKEGLEGLSIELTNEEGVVSKNNTLYAITVIPDKPPEVVFDEGQTEKESQVAGQKPRIRFVVSDDFKVQQVFLCVQSMKSLGEGETPDPAKAKEIPIPLPKPAARIAFNFEWTDPEKSVDWSDGQSFTCWIKAVDNNVVTGPGIGYSKPVEWSVVSLQAKRDELADQLRKNAESIRDLSGTQGGVRKSLQDLLKQDNQK